MTSSAEVPGLSVVSFVIGDSNEALVDTIINSGSVESNNSTNT